MVSNSIKTTPTITVLGAGYVGLTTAALFASTGLKVHVVEPNPERLKAIKQGKSFFFEAGIDILIKESLGSNLLLPTASYEESVPNSEVIFSCVGTPDKADGSSNLEYVFNAARLTAKLAQPGAIFIQKSTVPVGTGQIIIKVFKKHNTDLQYVSNPEFLREGTAVQDSLFFDRIVVGGERGATETVIDLYKKLESCRDTILKKTGLPASFNEGQHLQTSLESAELTKVTANAFLALKISFANSIAKLADATGADIEEVMNAVGSDSRIGRAFLSAGRGYGGGCFPKDVSGLIASSKQFGVDLEIMKAAQTVNSSMPAYIIDRVIKGTGESLAGKKIAVLGLAFKPGTSDARKSPGVKIANLLTEHGADVQAYDPEAGDEARHDLYSSVNIVSDLATILDNSNMIFVTTAWDEFLNIGFNTATNRHITLVDAVNMFNPEKFGDKVRYIGVGR